MQACIAAIFSFATAAGAASAPGFDDHRVLEQLAEAAKDSYQASSRLQTRFRVTVMRPRPAQEPAGHEEPLYAREFEMVVHDDQRLLREFVPATPDGQPAVTLVGIWDGHLWQSQAGRGETYIVEQRPPSDVVSDCWSFFHNIETMSVAGPSLAALQGAATLLEHIEQANKHTARIALNPEAETVCRLDYDVAPVFRVHSVMLEVFGAKGRANAGELLAAVSYKVEEWGDYGGVVLPKRARREIVMSSKAPGEGRAQATVASVVYERHSATFDRDNDGIRPDHGMLSVDGINVHDRTLKVGYQTGSRLIMVDGFVFEVAQPLHGLVRQGLPAVLTNARDVGEKEIVGGQDAQTTNQPMSEHGFQIGRGAWFAVITFMITAISLVPRSVREQAHRTRRIVPGVLMVLVLSLTAFAIGGWTGHSTGAKSLEGPLAGETAFDFGAVSNSGSDALRLEHAFTLRNVSSTPVRIERVSTSCGCTQATVSSTIVEPDQEVQVTATLEIVGTVHRREQVSLILRDYEPVVLQIAGTGRPIHEFYASEACVLLQPHASSEVILVAMSGDDQKPPPKPTVSLPPGVTAECSDWSLVYSRDPGLVRSARWQAVVRLSAANEAVAPRSKASFALGDRTVSVDLTGRPWK